MRSESCPWSETTWLISRESWEVDWILVVARRQWMLGLEGTALSGSLEASQACYTMWKGRRSILRTFGARKMLRSMWSSWHRINCRFVIEKSQKAIWWANDLELFGLLMIIKSFASLEPSVMQLTRWLDSGLEWGCGERGSGKYSQCEKEW